MGNCGFLATVAPIVSWLLVIGGWFFVSQDQDKKQRRKEYRDRIDAVVDLVDSIESDAIAYYLLDGSQDACPALASKIKTKFIKLRAKLEILNAIWSKEDYQQLRIDFWLVVTGEDFEVKTRKKLQSHDEKISEIAVCATSLTTALEGSYYSAYR